MGVASPAGNRGSHHAQRHIGNFMDILFGDWLPKARPAGAGFELCVRIEESRVAADAAVQPLIVQVPVLS